MFSRFRGKDGTPDPKQEAPDSRGLEVREDDPDTAWSLWDSALAEQDSRFSGLPPISAHAPLAPTPPVPHVRSEDSVEQAFPRLDAPTMPMRGSRGALSCTPG